MKSESEISGGLNSRTKKFAIEIFKVSDTIKDNSQTRVIKNQLLRSASSVAANTRASFKARSKKEYIAKIGVVIEEADESAFWLEFLLELNLIEINIGNTLRKEADELVSIFTSISKKFRNY